MTIISTFIASHCFLVNDFLKDICTKCINHKHSLRGGILVQTGLLSREREGGEGEGGEGEGEREREGERDRQTDRQTKRDRQRNRDRENTQKTREEYH